MKEVASSQNLLPLFLAQLCLKSYIVRHWRFLFTINLAIKFILSLNPELERDGRKGSLAKFDCRVGFVRFANVP